MALLVGQSKYEEGIIGDFYTRNITARTKVEFMGNWEKVSMIFSQLPKDIQTSVYKAILQYSTQYHGRVKRAILNNGPSSTRWAPFSPKYAKYKSSHGSMGFPAFYRLRGNLIKAITVQSDGRKVVRVTINKNARVTNPKSGLTASQLMNILEHGSITRGIAARPLFGPVWSEMGGNKALREFVSKKVSVKLKSYSSKL